MTQTEETTTTLFAGIDDTVASWLSAWKVPGLALAVVKDGEMVFARGFGKRDLTGGEAVTPQTIFAIGSSSKAFTAASLAMLVDEGKLNWDRPVREYIPFFKLYDTVASERITPRDLLIHNSGLPRHDLAWYRSSRSRKELVEGLRYLEPSKDFRSTWQYQNMMYATAGYLVECVSGLSWEDFVQQRIFAPLGMSNSYVNDTSAREHTTNYSLPYREKDGEIQQIPFYSHWQALGPAGSIHSNVEDLCKWLLLHLNKGKVGDRQLISEGQMTQLHSPQMAGVDRELITLDPKKLPEIFYSSYAMGWVVTSYRGNVLLHHGGSIGGFHALVAFMPNNNIGVAVLTNTHTSMLETVAVYHMLDLLLGVEPADWHGRHIQIYQGLMDAMKKGKEELHAGRVPDTRPSHDLSAYTGTFEHGGYGRVLIELEGEQLKIEYNNTKASLEHFHYDSFVFSFAAFDIDLKVTFTANARGDIECLAIPLEGKVADIVFKRVASKELQESSYLEQFAGEYEIVLGENTLAVSVILQGEALIANAPGQSNVELEPYKENEFRFKSTPSQIIIFVRDAEGQISHARLPGGISARRV
ncbi:MAG TPA: serine hydrolase [Ktedonosporobacter sp.]|jgi:CubicO group peptidase (beta-lactamase class C family)|nr:serine hydrolase [Ktedonosporobacter sp.]